MDGRIQAHGFYEAQLRVISADYSEDWDLSQWYNVFNLEMEIDFAPEGFGPFDLFQAFVRLEGRYDCVYSRGCGMVKGADAYGDRAKNLPPRLSNAFQTTYHGAVELDEIRVRRHDWKTFTRDFDNADLDGDTTTGDFETQAAMNIRQEVTLNGSNFFGNRGLQTIDDVPGLSGLGAQVGADGFEGRAPCFQTGNPACALTVPANASADGGLILLDFPTMTRTGEFFLRDDDPFPFVFSRFLAEDFKFTAIRGRGGAGGGAPITALGPWLPKNHFTETGMLADFGNPFDNSVADGQLGDLLQAAAFNGSVRRNDTGINFDPNKVPFDPTKEDGVGDPPPPGVVISDTRPFTQDLLEEHRLAATSTRKDLDELNRNAGGGLEIVTFLGATFPVFREGASQAILKPSSPSRLTAAKPFRSIPFEDELNVRFFADMEARLNGYSDFAAAVAGASPAQIDAIEASARKKYAETSVVGISRLAQTVGRNEARGLYLPSPAFTDHLRRGTGKHPFNIDETDRAWNRGESQDDEGELKEAFLDIEMFDHKLWLRLGKQSIVWGKTELFRTTDQFNPQDLGLAVLPNLEESRIALWSARAVYSLYDIGPLRDVRLELAANLDDNEPADIGACGEPYAPLPVCVATFGLFAHGALGLGLAGVEKPPSPWEDLSGWEVGGRVEWRWARFSFALTDFYGYDDLPFIDIIGLYERNVDYDTGRPRAYGAFGPCRTQPIGARQAAPANSAFGFDGTTALLTPDPDCLQAGPTLQQQFQTADLRAPGALLDGITKEVFAFGTVVARRTLASNEFLADSDAVNNEGEVIIDPAAIVSASAVDLTTYDGFVVDAAGNIWNPARPDEARGLLRAAVSAPTAFTLQAGTGSYSPNNSLQANPGNQQIFGVVCGSTVGVSTIDAAACAASVFGSGRPIPPFGFTAGQFIAGSLAGQLKVDAGQSNADQLRAFNDGVLSTLAAAGNYRQRTQFAFGNVGPLTRINRDIGDGEAGGIANDSNPSFGIAALFAPSNHGCVDSSIWYLVDQTPARGESGTFPDGQTAGGENITLVPCHSGGGGQLGEIARGLGQHLSPEQQALLGCGPFYGTNCDDSGIDLYNMEASSLAQSWVGFEGTQDPAGANFRVLNAGLSAAGGLPTIWTMNNRKADGTVDGRAMILDGQDREQPGTLFFRGGPVGTYFDRASNQLKKLPGTRGLVGDPETRTVALEDGYDAAVDGCPITQATFTAINRGGGAPVELAPCSQNDVTGEARRDLVHPLANFNTNGGAFTRNNPQRGLLEPGATRQYFRSEMAAVSFNALMLLASLDSEFEADFPFALCEPDPDDINRREPNPGCLRDSSGRDVRTCSLATPQFCGNVRGIMQLTGVQRNIVRAGGDGTFGRRTFLWHSGGEAVLRYNKRNVLGFSVDFAEDITKSNFSIESTWIENVARSDPNSFNGVHRTDDINVTMSMDRPTFLNFLNANRTIFFNTQWFFQYRFDHEKGVGGPNGPWNLLLTFTAFTGFFQDRLMPRVTLIYDVQSVSGGALTELSFRFNEAFSIILGTQTFWGRTQMNPIPLANLAPASNQQGRHAYQTGVVTGAGIVRDVDGAFLRLRYTF